MGLDSVLTEGQEGPRELVGETQQRANPKEVFGDQEWERRKVSGELGPDTERLREWGSKTQKETTS